MITGLEAESFLSVSVHVIFVSHNGFRSNTLIALENYYKTTVV